MNCSGNSQPIDAYDTTVLKVAVGEEPVRLDVFILQQMEADPRFVNLSRSMVQRWIRNGGVVVDGKGVVKPGVLTREGATIAVTPQYPDEKALTLYDFPLEILYEDTELVVVNKPAGLTVHPGAGNHDRTLVNALASHYRDYADRFERTLRPGIVHRLDKDTTGLIVVALSPDVMPGLSAQFFDRSASRRYLGLVKTTPRGKSAPDTADKGVIEAPIGRHAGNRLKMAVREDGRFAKTEWRVVERMTHANLLEFTLSTGRTHQIRVHVEHAGFPLVGDPVYCGDCTLPVKLAGVERGFGRQALHARLLGFKHPLHNTDLEFQVDPPRDFLSLCQSFREQ